jgi:hypothetical protein
LSAGTHRRKGRTTWSVTVSIWLATVTVRGTNFGAPVEFLMT